jgi:nitrogen regulatory protein P-II 2
VKLEIAVTESFLEKTINAISETARSGNIGDGKIFVTDLSSVVRIRTGETGDEAIG